MTDTDGSNFYIQIDEGHIVACPKNIECAVGDKLIVFPSSDGVRHAMPKSFFDKIKSLSTDKSLTIEKLKFLTELKL